MRRFSFLLQTKTSLEITGKTILLTLAFLYQPPLSNYRSPHYTEQNNQGKLITLLTLVHVHVWQNIKSYGQVSFARVLSILPVVGGA